MNSEAHKTVAAIGKVFYWLFAGLFTLAALGMSFISDGTVPLYVHVIFPVATALVFVAPPIIWRRLNHGITAPEFIQHNQKKLLIGLGSLYIGMMAIYLILGNK